MDIDKIIDTWVKRILEKDNYNDYKTLEYEIHTRAVGYHLTSKEAEDLVDDVSMHWTKEQTNQFKGNHEENDFYAALNLVYCIFKNEKYSVSDYVTLANSFLNDEERLIKYYYFVL